MSFNKFPAIAATLRPACKQLVAKTATTIATTYTDTAPRRSGFMAESAYVATSDSSTYSQGTLSPSGDAYLLPEEKPSDAMTAIAAVAANYAEFVEFGTRFMGAQPAFIPAVEAARVTFDAELAAIQAKIERI